MPKEHIRGPKSKPVSFASTSSASSVPTDQQPTKSTSTVKKVIISSDEECGDELAKVDISDIDEVPTTKYMGIRKPEAPNSAPLRLLPQNMAQPALDTPLFSPPKRLMPIVVPVSIPSNKDVQMVDGEEANLSKSPDESVFLLSADLKKVLDNLMGSGTNQELDLIDINTSDAVVGAFNDGITLLPHQVLGSTWMKDRENPTMTRIGGILADDVGLGNIIQMLTRIVNGKPNRVDRDEGWSDSTLVVCPVDLVGQWADEIKTITRLRVLVYQGENRTTDPLELQKYHVVVTTYDTIESEYESSESSKATNDFYDPESESLGRKKAAGKDSVKRSAIYSVKWWRIVLDEAHNIKIAETKGAISCCELESKFRWCLTCTPMQNNVTELYSLLKFLRIKPLSNWDTFNEHIAKPLNNGHGAGLAMKRLQFVLRQIALRRVLNETYNS